MTKRCLKRMINLFTIAILLVFVNPAQGQVGQSYWKYLNPKTFGFNVNDVSFVDNNNGIAVGDGGGIAKTTDGGLTWTYGAFTFIDANNSVQKPTFNDVHYVTPTIAYAVGSYGLFAKTTDGGLNWTAMDNPYTALGSNSIQPYAVWFTSAMTGYMGGTKNVPTGNVAPYLYTTTNGGITWDSVAAPIGADMLCGDTAAASPNRVINQINALNKTIYSIKFVNGIGYVSGSGGSIPGLPFPRASGSNAVLFWKYQAGNLKDYSISKEKLDTLHTAGTRYGTFIPVSQNYRAMQPINDSVVLMASQNNAIVLRVSTGVNDSTRDRVNAGQNVTGKYELLHYTGYPSLPNSLPTYNMFNMEKAPDGKLYVTQGNAQLGVTNDNGTTWTLTRAFQPPSNTSGFLFSGVAVTPNGKIIAMGQEGSVADSVPGTTWHTNYENYKVGGGSVNKIEFADCDNGIGVGGFGNISVTTDAGNTWVDKTVPSFAAANISLYGMSYPNPNQLYFTSSNGGVYSSSDKGTTNDIIFQAPPLGTTSTILYGLASKGNRIWAMGRRNSPVNQSYVFRSMNAGATWDTIMPYPSGTTSSSINYIFFATPDTGYITGSRGKVYRTVDAGTTWTDVSPDPAFISSFTDMYLLTKDTIFVCGFSRKVYKSFDAGANWTEISVNITNPSQFIGNFGSIIMHDKDNGYLMSNSGTSLMTNDGGVTWIPQNAPSTGIFASASFVPAVAPAGTPFANRRVIIASSPNHFFEYGNPLTININSSETITNASCTNPTGGSITINATGGFAPYTFSIDGINFQSSNIFTGLNQGAKTITIKEAGCGRIKTKVVNVGFNDNLTLATSNNTLVCKGTPVQLLATANSGSATYVWTPSTGLSNTTINNPVATPSSTTTYTVTTSLNGCTRTGTVVVGIKDVNVNAGADVAVCVGTPVQLQATSDSTGVTYSWSPSTGLSNPNIRNPIANIATTTTYVVTASLNGCTKTDDVVVTIRKINVNAGANKVVCAGIPTQLQATSDSTGVSYSWSPSTGLSNASISNPIATLNNTTTYTVTASKYGCTATGTTTVTVNQNPIINAGPDKTIVGGDQVILDGTSVNPLTTIAWTPSASIISGANTLTPITKPVNTTTYTLSVVNANGCTATDNAVVTVIPYCIKVMDAFTPNGDGMNDRWLVTNGASCASKVSVTVFNRYGGKVYQNDNYQNNWEGTYDGKKVADGTYYYVVIYRLINGQSISMKGDVTILR